MIALRDSTMTETEELPSGWEWWTGNSSDTYYTYNFGTEYYMGGALAGEYGLGGMFGQVTWDEGGKHTVMITPVTSMNGDDPVYGYPVATESFETEEEALEAVPEMINNL